MYLDFTILNAKIGRIMINWGPLGYGETMHPEQSGEIINRVGQPDKPDSEAPRRLHFSSEQKNKITKKPSSFEKFLSNWFRPDV